MSSLLQVEKMGGWFPPPPPPASLTRGSEGSTGTQPCQSLGRREWSAGDTGPDGTEGTGRGGTESLGGGESASTPRRTEIARFLPCRLDGEGTAGGEAAALSQWQWVEVVVG